MDRRGLLLAHPVNSRQRSTSVAFGAKRTLTEPPFGMNATSEDVFPSGRRRGRGGRQPALAERSRIMSTRSSAMKS